MIHTDRQTQSTTQTNSPNGHELTSGLSVIGTYTVQTHQIFMLHRPRTTDFPLPRSEKVKIRVGGWVGKINKYDAMELVMQLLHVTQMTHVRDSC